MRQGLPRATQPGQPVFLDHCVPVLPNTHHPTDRKPLCPAHPLPWANCYVDASPDFNFVEIRVTATPRDYTVVLPCDEDNMDYIIDRFGDDRWEHPDRVDNMQRGDIEAIAALALPPSPTSAFNIPLPFAPLLDSVEVAPDGNDDPDLDELAHAHMPDVAEDDVSIIASDDEVSLAEADRPAHPDDLDVNLLFQMEAMFDTSGNVNDPVVNVWYDLDMIHEVLDPLLFLEERAKIRECVLSTV